jgi:hypothetical protein
LTALGCFLLGTHSSELITGSKCRVLHHAASTSQRTRILYLLIPKRFLCIKPHATGL